MKLPFAAWLVLVTLYELEREIGEELNQNAIANSAGLSRMVVSYWIAVFEREGWIDRDEHFKPQAFGVGITDSGLRVLHECYERLEGLRGNG
jgi:DNA-binding GntR family transcriptional regulator